MSTKKKEASAEQTFTFSVRCIKDRNAITAKGYAFVDFAIEVCNALDIFEIGLPQSHWL